MHYVTPHTIDLLKLNYDAPTQVRLLLLFGL